MRSGKVEKNGIGAEIWDLPVICASSTISAPNTEKALTNSVKVATDSNLPNVLDICGGRKNKFRTDMNEKLAALPYLWLIVTA